MENLKLIFTRSIAFSPCGIQTLNGTSFSNIYPVSWGDGMYEVVAGDPKQNNTTDWTVNFYQLPNLGEFIIYDTVSRV